MSAPDDPETPPSAPASSGRAGPGSVEAARGEPASARPQHAQRPLFARWANSLTRIVLLAMASSLIAVPAFCVAWARTPYSTGQFDPLPQPVMFDHRHHVRDDGIDCRYCHGAAEKSAYAGVPPTETCMNCHGQIWNDAPLLSEVRKSFFTGQPLHWARVNALPDHVFFNHAAHVNHNVGCVSCHGRVDLMGQVFQAQPLTMRWCLDCHRNPEPHLRPQARITDMEWTPDRPAAELGREIRLARHIDPPTHCAACHR